MKVVVAGGTGFLGSRLVAMLARRGHEVLVLTRSPRNARQQALPMVRYVPWDVQGRGQWPELLEGSHAVVNLVGEVIGGWRWTSQRKHRILESRITATRALVEAIRSANQRPHVFISASATNYYNTSTREVATEASPPGEDFLSSVCVAWEHEASQVQRLGVRLVVPRIGIVLDPTHGALPRFLLPFRLFLGGPLGSGRQWFPWVHPQDVLGVMLETLEQEDFSGPLNVTAPGIVTMDDFCAHLGQTLGRPSWLRIPGPALRIALGEMSVLVLEGARVIPERLLSAGYRFHFPRLEEALKAILSPPG